jgi:TonB family protein
LQPVDVHDSVHLVAPDLTPQPQKDDEPIAVHKSPVPLPKPTVTPKLEVRLPRVPPPPVETPPKPIEVAKVTPPSIPLPKTPRRVVTTGDFGSSAPVTLQKPVHQVQTGGFGDPNGVPANPNAANNKGPAIAKVGTFDLPGGPGVGNGTGGATGARGAVASAGFGNGIAGPGQGGVGPGSQKKVQATTFSADPPPLPDVPKRQTPTSAAKDTSVSLLSKPTPVYTSEARQKKIEGDVELDVEFTATGQIHVLSVLHGLGYGLDEAAVAAAQQIRFNPARRDGQPVDSHAHLRIVFRLS